MNRPSHEDDGWDHPEWNQNPPALAGDLTTRNDLNGIVNSRQNRDRRIDDDDLNRIHPEPYELTDMNEKGKNMPRVTEDPYPGPSGHQPERLSSSSTLRSNEMPVSGGKHLGKRIMHVLAKYAKFVGPGVMISVAYIDPGNYSTAVAAGATFRFRLLFIVFLSNLFAVYLQCLCVKLGSVTGMNLAEMIRAHCPRWLNWILYLFGEAAIICTDIAEVIGTAIALNLLFHIPLVAGCAISIVDVLVILLFYKPNGTVRGVRIFEGFVALLVLGVVVCFCYQLSLITNTSVGDVFRGYLPSSAIVKSKGLYQSCGILGATVMPHSLYLGSGIVQPRLKEYDMQHDNIPPPSDDDDDSGPAKYRPSVAAVKSCMKYSIVELSTSLFIFALFVNSAILIVAGSSLYNTDAATADLFGIHKLLAHQLAPVAGTIFALALLLSGISAGIVCTIAGQMICEGQLTWSVKPWVRRLMTRSISITPSIIIAGAVGAEGLSAALDGSQVALSVILPFVSAPLIYFTCRERYMTMPASNGDLISMRNHWFTAIIAVLIWLIIVVMNVALLVLLGLGEG
ncbi:natural resistance-associated macrophage protein, partial [Aureobasidium melanogenum]